VADIIMRRGGNFDGYFLRNIERERAEKIVGAYPNGYNGATLEVSVSGHSAGVVDTIHFQGYAHSAKILVLESGRAVVVVRDAFGGLVKQIEYASKGYAEKALYRNWEKWTTDESGGKRWSK